LVYIFAMEIIGLYEAKTRLSELVRDALDGEDVIISRHGKPTVRLVPVEKAERVRELGFFTGTVTIAADFDETPEDFGDYM
jgi:prevent-host-death family protein